jgi:hypothetical protein
MQKNHVLASPEHETDVEIALAIHYLDPEFNAEATGEIDGAVLGSFMRSVGLG